MLQAEDVVLLAEARVRVARGDLRSVRGKARLSQDAIGGAVGVSRAAICRWEAGERKPSGEAAVRLARLLRELDLLPGAISP